ncbi:hypothetical protein DFH06DRAFT_744657 [Mycena polygramma]|nr:hypothetical protein DFH06DRAFT_744657 [Mycena polygramma]
MAHPNFLLNSHTLVMGGSSGIGFAVASGALSSGSKVHITSATAEKLSAKIKELQSFYPGAHVGGSAVDLSNADALETNLQSLLDAAVKDTGGPLDHIVYTAGDGLGNTPLAEATVTTALAPFTMLYLGPLLIAKLVAANPGRYLKPKHKSSITLTSGILGHRPCPGLSAVIAVGGAVETLGKALAVDLAPIRVNVIIPGTVKTEMLYKMVGENTEAFKSSTLTKELGTPEGAAEAYLFCMRSALATGQGFMIDNGRSLV